MAMNRMIAVTSRYFTGFAANYVKLAEDSPVGLQQKCNLYCNLCILLFGVVSFMTADSRFSANFFSRFLRTYNRKILINTDKQLKTSK